MTGARKPSRPARPAARRPTRGAPEARPRAAAPARAPLGLRLGTGAVWLLLVVTPLILSPAAKEGFRLPKLLMGGCLALASLFLLSWDLLRLDGDAEVKLGDLWRRPAVRAVLPALAVASLGFWTTAHPHHFRDGLADLWIGAAALVGWSLAFDAGRLERLLRVLLVPAALLGLIGILQSYGLFPQIQLAGVEEGQRLAITSTAGNPGDLGAYLVLPCLLAQWSLATGKERKGRPDWLALGALALCLYALALTQTIAALAALLLGSLVLWAGLLPRRKVLFGAAGAVALAAVLVLAVTPLRVRAMEKLGQVARGDVNAALTGRLDGWYAALRMFQEHPMAGVGHGAYRPEFVPAKLELLDRGVHFYPGQTQVVFANAHNEFLEVAAEWGVPGVLALGWGLWVLIAAVRRIPGPAGGARAFAWAGAAAFGVLALAQFPFRIALVAYPALLFLSWVFRTGDPGNAESSEPEAAA